MQVNPITDFMVNALMFFIIAGLGLGLIAFIIYSYHEFRMYFREIVEASWWEKLGTWMFWGWVMAILVLMELLFASCYIHTLYLVLRHS